MHCEACTKLSTKRIKSIDGVTDTSVDLISRTATIRAKRPLTVDDVNTVLIDSDYRAEEYHD